MRATAAARRRSCPAWRALKSVEYNHTPDLTKVRTTGPRSRSSRTDMRLDMIEAARIAKIDYTVQIQYNDRLRPTQIWGGDIVDAHHAGVRVAAKTYCTQQLEGPDIVVANAYPQCAQCVPRRGCGSTTRSVTAAQE